MKSVRPILAVLALLLAASPGRAEYRRVLIQLKPDKEKKASVTIFSDERKEKKSAVPLDEGVKAIQEMRGWGSLVGVYLTSERGIPSADLKKLLAAITDNVWLELEYFGREVPKVVGDHFLKDFREVGDIRKALTDTPENRKAGREVLSEKKAKKNRPAPAPRASDVVLIANWLSGKDPNQAFPGPFGDRGFLMDSKDSLLYTDIPGVKVPPGLKAVKYEFIQARMRQIRSGHKESPAVVIVRSSLDESGKDTIRSSKDPPGGRVYYVEVAIGNLAWIWLKVEVRDEGEKPRARILWRKVS